jgi:hypothetical protein
MSEDEVALLGDAMDRIDLELVAAERAGDVKTQIDMLRQRGMAWRAWAQMLQRNGRDSHGAILAAQRDELTADELEAGAL